MVKKQTTLKATPLEWSIGAAVLLAMFVCYLADLLGFQIQTLAACTSAVMCVQDSKTTSWKAGITRILGVVCGGMVGIVIVLLDNRIGNEYVFMLLCGIGSVGNLMLCKVVKLPLVQARVSCMSLLLVVLVLQGATRIQYAAGRFFGTLCGAVVALVVSMLCSYLPHKNECTSTT